MNPLLRIHHAVEVGLKLGDFASEGGGFVRNRSKVDARVTRKSRRRSRD